MKDTKQRMLQVYRSLLRLLDLQPTKLHQSYLTKTISRLHCWVESEGHQGIARWKLVSTFLTRVLLGLDCLDYPSTWRSRRGNIPRRFERLMDLSDIDHKHFLLVLGVLNLHRLVKLEPVFDTSSIEEGHSAWKEYVKGWWSYYKPINQLCKLFPSPPWKPSWRSISWEWNISAAQGPNGKSVDKFIEDAYVIAHDIYLRWGFYILSFGHYTAKWKWFFDIREIKETFRCAVQSLNGQQHSGYGLVDRFLYGDSKKRNLKHSRLAFLPDKSGKTRVVALFDSFSQTVLKPIHNHLFNFLRKISSVDGTFDQDSQRERVAIVTDSPTVCYSLDMKSCTDRFPASFQAYILWKLCNLPLYMAIAWYVVMTKRSFWVPDPSGSRYVRYAVGQPMGALSSWPAMAVSHHAVVQLSASLCGEEPWGFMDYSILGDDIIIWDDKVASKYHELITQWLGIQISESKSLVGQYVAEYAKSVFLRGRLVSSIPVNALEFNSITFLGDIMSILKYAYFARIPVTPIQISRLYNRKSQDRMLRVILNPLSPYYIDADFYYLNRHLKVMVEVKIIQDWVHQVVTDEFQRRNIDWLNDGIERHGNLLGALYQKIKTKAMFATFSQVASRFNFLMEEYGLTRKATLELFKIHIGRNFITYNSAAWHWLPNYRWLVDSGVELPFIREDPGTRENHRKMTETRIGKAVKGTNEMPMLTPNIAPIYFNKRLPVVRADGFSPYGPQTCDRSVRKAGKG